MPLLKRIGSIHPRNLDGSHSPSTKDLVWYSVRWYTPYLVHVRFSLWKLTRGESSGTGIWNQDSEAVASHCKRARALSAADRYQQKPSAVGNRMHSAVQ